MEHAVLETQGTVPSSKDWDMHRETIIHLYIGRNMSLPRLKEHMDMEYSFRATKNMYKLRFTQWGVNKNVNADRVVARLKQGMAHRSSPVAGNQPVEMKKLKAYICRLPADRRKQLLNTILEPLMFTTSSASLLPLAPPDNIRLPEHYIYLLQAYVRGASEGNLWPRDKNSGFKNEDIVPAWCTSVMSAAWVLNEGKENEAKKLLQLFIKQCPEQLARQDPLLFSFIYTSVLFFSRKRPDIAKSLLRDLYNISENLPWAGSSHPLRLLLNLLYHLGPENIISYASNILLSYINIIHETLGAAYPIVQDMLSDIMDRLLSYNLMSNEKVADLGHRMVLAAEAQGQDRCKYYLRLKMRLSASYLRMGKYHEARETVMEILAAQNTDIGDERMLVQLHMILCRINEAEGRQEEAIASALGAVVASISTFGQWAPWTNNSLIFYRRVLERAGKTAEAQRVMQDRDLVTQMLCNKAESLELSD